MGMYAFFVNLLIFEIVDIVIPININDEDSSCFTLNS